MAENNIAEHVVALKLSEQAPKVAEAIASAYKKVGNITIVGGGDTAGNLNSVIAKGIAQVGTTLESLTGKNPFSRKKDVVSGFGGLPTWDDETDGGVKSGFGGLPTRANDEEVKSESLSESTKGESKSSSDSDSSSSPD